MAKEKIYYKMNRIVAQLDKQLGLMNKKGWGEIYIGVDIHETVLKPTWSHTLSDEFYDDAKEVLQMMSEMSEFRMILWSCSLPHLNKQYSEFFKGHNISFDYINENPECKSTEYADFETKLYFSVGFDDKFGFIPAEDWPALKIYLINMRKNKESQK